MYGCMCIALHECVHDIVRVCVQVCVCVYVPVYVCMCVCTCIAPLLYCYTGTTGHATRKAVDTPQLTTVTAAQCEGLPSCSLVPRHASMHTASAPDSFPLSPSGPSGPAGPLGALASCSLFSSAVCVSAVGVFCVTFGVYEPPALLEARTSSKELRMNLAT